jgi:hypothetical protein
MEKYKKFDSKLIDGLFLIALGIALMIYSLSSFNSSTNKIWSQSPYLFPLLISVIIVLLSLNQIYKGAKSKVYNEDQSNEKITNPNIKGVLIVLGIVFAYYLALDLVSIPMVTITIASFPISISVFEVSTLFLLVVLQLYLGVKKISVITLVSLLTTLFLSIAFRTLLRVLLP